MERNSEKLLRGRKKRKSLGVLFRVRRSCRNKS